MKIISIGLMMIWLSGCSSELDPIKSSENDVLPVVLPEENVEVINSLAQFPSVYSEAYTEFELDIEKIESPRGITCRDNDMIITDYENDMVFVVDYNGVILQEVGGTGNASGQFQSPSEVEIYENQIYILDEKNFRVQVFDSELNFIQEIVLEQGHENESDFCYSNIAVVEEGIYVSGLSLYEEGTFFYPFGSKEPEAVGANFFGDMETYNEGVYGINSMIKTYEKNTESLGYANGFNYLLSINGEKMEIVEELQAGLYITDFVMDDGGVFAIARTFGELMVFSTDGGYQNTIVQKSELLEEDAHVAINPNGDVFMTLMQSGKIFKYSAK